MFLFFVQFFQHLVVLIKFGNIVQRRRRIFIRRSSSHFGALSWQGLNPIKLIIACNQVSRMASFVNSLADWEVSVPAAPSSPSNRDQQPPARTHNFFPGCSWNHSQLWRPGREERGQGCSCPFPKFQPVREFSSWQKIFFWKYKIWGWISPSWGNLGAKFNFWAPIIYSVGNLQLSVRKLRLLVTHDTADCQYPQSDGHTRLSWPGWLVCSYIGLLFNCHPSQN